VKHEWKHVDQGIKGLSNYGKRECEHCGATQVKNVKHRGCASQAIGGILWSGVVKENLMKSRIEGNRRQSPSMRRIDEFMIRLGKYSIIIYLLWSVIYPVQ